MKTLAAALLAVSAFAADIPRTWEKSAVETLELPLAKREFSPTHIDEVTYYRITERVIYKSYPVYAPGREPTGYAEWLRRVEPEVAFDPSRLTSPNQWVAAGEVVFNAPTSLHPGFFTAENLRDPDFLKRTGLPVAKDGTIPFAGPRYLGISRSGRGGAGASWSTLLHTEPGGPLFVTLGTPVLHGREFTTREGSAFISYRHPAL